ncbi:MAG TPA: cytochrome c [Vicinamibacterales bacterium]|nr:cytochrome c [Vicinamibacterales bacterium]
MKLNRKRRGQLVVAFCALAFAAGCRQDMHNQPKYRPLRPSALFADGSSARQPVEGTVARGALNADEALFTGKADGVAVKEMPFAITAADLDRGQQRFNIYCTPCHDQSGNGNGMVVQRGYRKPPSYHIERLKQADPGYIFDVISNGFGAMPDYKAQIDVRDRWRIVAYVKALQMAPGAGAPGAADSMPTPATPPATPPKGGGH